MLYISGAHAFGFENMTLFCGPGTNPSKLSRYPSNKISQLCIDQQRAREERLSRTSKKPDPHTYLSRNRHFHHHRCPSVYAHPCPPTVRTVGVVRRIICVRVRDREQLRTPTRTTVDAGERECPTMSDVAYHAIRGVDRSRGGAASEYVRGCAGEVGRVLVRCCSHSVVELIDQRAVCLNRGSIRRVDRAKGSTCPYVDDIRGYEADVGKIKGDRLGSIHPVQKHLFIDLAH